MSTHRAAILPYKGSRLMVVDRPTPRPSPGDVLIRVGAVALNPIDISQRDAGLPPPVYPAVLGFDVAGTVVEVGAAVPAAELGLAAGVRVLAFATSFYEGGSADYGAFQEYVLAKAEGVLALPAEISLAEGATLPTATVTAVTAWQVAGISLPTTTTTTTMTPAVDREAALVWGASSSIGSLAVQTARQLGFAAVYATASPANHDYVRMTLGADAVFDRTAPDVAAQIAAAAARDGVCLRTAHVAVAGGLEPTLAVLKTTKPGAKKAHVAHSPLLPPDAPTPPADTTVRFTMPLLDAAERARVLRWGLHVLLKDGLASGSIVPSPPVTLAPGGLAGLNAALDTLRGGVSCTKIVVLLEEEDDEAV